MIKKLGIAILVVSSITGGNIAAQQTQKFTAAKHNEYGLVYSLPITHFDIEVVASKKINTAGPYYKYAKKYLSSDNAITEDGVSWNLISIEARPYGVADKDNQYLMQFKSGSAPFLILDSAGLPLAINKEQNESILSRGKGETSKPTILETDAIGKAISGEVLVSESTAKKAEITAGQIYKIRETRVNIISGEADVMPPDGESLKLMMAQLDAQEAALTALFLGTSRVDTKVMHFDYTPQDNISNEVIFRMSDFNGVVDKNDLSGEPVYLSLKVIEEGALPVNEKGEQKKLPKGAVMYKIPGKANLNIKYQGKSFLNENYDVAQFGVDFGLDPAMFTDKKQPSYIIFNPQTGAIKEIGNAVVPSDK